MPYDGTDFAISKEQSTTINAYCSWYDGLEASLTK